MAIIYQGPSMIDGQPIVVLTVAKSGNSKTGGMIQTHILREDTDPRAANQSGKDFSICGKCPHAGNSFGDNFTKIVVKYNKKKNRHYVSVPTAGQRSCYVNLGQGPLQAWKAYRRGRHAVADPVEVGRGALVRVGSYGDPAAVPADVWIRLLSEAKAWTGYSHQSELVDSLPGICMQSADSLAQAQNFWARGERTFRVVSSVEEIDRKREVLCPASKEAGYRSTCAECKLCNGTASKSPKSVAIVAHGAGAKYAKARSSDDNIIARG